MYCMTILQRKHLILKYIFRNPGYKNLLEYLFWIWDPEVPGGQTDVARILEDGFPDASTYKVCAKLSIFYSRVVVLTCLKE